MDTTVPILLRHDDLGECELVRTEGTDWIVKFKSSGDLRRVSISSRQRYTRLENGESSAVPPRMAPAKPQRASLAKGDSLAQGGRQRLWHKSLGECELLRSEGTDWIIRLSDFGIEYRCPSHGRSAFTPIEARITSAGRKDVIPDELDEIASADASLSTRVDEFEGVTIRKDEEDTTDVGEWLGNSADQPTLIDDSVDERALRKAMESLRNGLPPSSPVALRFAIGVEKTLGHVRNLLKDVSIEGGRACVLRGAYGQGKSFCLQLLKETALDEGYIVASTEIDAYENKIEKPNQIYRDLLKNLRLPGGGPQGSDGLIEKSADFIKETFPDTGHLVGQDRAREIRRRLSVELQCEPLAWLLSDPNLAEKPLLRQLLAYTPGISIPEARRSHLITAEPREWPAFTAGTQGDFASYLISGLGRLARLLDYKGLIIVMDEMEKWEQLDWKAQCRAGNLFGGLIWGATAERGHRCCSRIARADGQRHRCDHPTELEHSRVAGGFPFSTFDRSFVGVAVAMTPRGENGPEAQWSKYGIVEVVDLPSFTPASVRNYCERIAPLYATAYGIPNVPVAEISEQAVRGWRSFGNESPRTAILATIEALDSWRNRGLNL